MSWGQPRRGALGGSGGSPEGCCLGALTHSQSGLAACLLVTSPRSRVRCPHAHTPTPLPNPNCPQLPQQGAGLILGHHIWNALLGVSSRGPAAGGAEAAALCKVLRPLRRAAGHSCGRARRSGHGAEPRAGGSISPAGLAILLMDTQPKHVGCRVEPKRPIISPLNLHPTQGPGTWHPNASSSCRPMWASGLSR